MSKEDRYCEYLLRNIKEESIKNKVSFSHKNETNTRYNPKFIHQPNECFKYTIEKMFGLKNIKCKLYDSVINGEGNEKDKINSIYSSSLQSLVVFHSVDKNHPIKITIDNKELTFTNVYFEQKNKVIGYPSSVDVVLTNKDSVLFIESKLFEIIRNSTDSKELPKVVGVSYLSKRESSYFNVFGFDKDELKSTGIHSDKYPIEDKTLNKDDSESITQIEGNTFVYPEGIKQVLSHIIGITNFAKGNYHDGCIRELKEKKFKKFYFIELYNKLPGFDLEGEDKIEEILNQFERHVKKVFEVVKDKVNVVCDIKTYQDIYLENKELFNDIVVKYYHLDNK